MSSVGTVASIYSITENRKARKATAKENQLAKQEAAAKRRRERQQALAQANAARQSVRAKAAAAGVSEASSSIEQVQGSLTSQLNSNVGFLKQLETSEQSRFEARARANKHAGNAETAQGIATLAFQLESSGAGAAGGGAGAAGAGA